ncbi:MAG TPA: PQQ-binding-like beta-propeller repeat protein [Kofleriaceae bacterium]|nr:PQQ-binding-like beta-propeller repeat protein [Kofleriaceae bacterium]
MHRWVALLALAACEPTAPPAEAGAAALGAAARLPVVWQAPPAAAWFPLGAVRGRIGRSQAPQPLVDLGIAASAGGLEPLRLPAGFAVPGDGPARAVLFGSEAGRPAIELVEVDTGRAVWRDRTRCAAPIVGATAEVVVCADAGGTRAVGLDGALRWRTGAAFAAFTDDRVVVSDAGAAVVLDAASGDELARIRLPGGVSPASVIASCGDAGRELFAAGEDGRLVRIAEALGGPAIKWAVPSGAILAIDACDAASVVVTESGPAGLALVAIARATGKSTGRLDGVRGAWPARDGSDRIEVATARGLASYPRDLAGPAVRLGGPPLGELIASRGDRRLVRATPSTAVLLDRRGVQGYVALAALGAVLGDAALIATTWIGSPGEAARRLALPPPWRRALRLPALHRGVAVDAELRDLPPVLPLDTAAAVALPDTGMHGVTALAVDPADGAALYAVASDGDGRGGGAAVARADLAARRWRWQRVDGCGPGTPVAIAVARDVVVCGARGPRASVRATSRDGQARWEWTTGNLDDLAAAGDAIVVHDAGRATVLDARDGRVRGQLASDDGGAVRAALVAVGDSTLLIAAERGRVVARLAIGGLLPVWSLEVAGAVRALTPAGEGVLVALEDGDAYRLDARDGAAVALPGLGLGWHAAGDLVTGDTVGGPIPGPAPPVPPAPPPTFAQLLRRPLQILRGEIDVPPPMSTPIKPPPPLGDSWQLTLYELGGGLRARNDYALAAPVAPPAPRGPPGSPLAVVYGTAQREVCVLDPRTGHPMRRIALPDDAAPGAVFATVVDGSPVAGAVLASPLRVVLF